MVVAALLSLLAILTASHFWLARRVARLSKLASAFTRRAQAPQKWESRLAELGAEVASLSSSFEKVATAVTRQNARTVMRDRRSLAQQPVDGPPPVGASKAEIRKYYGLDKAGPDFARAQLALVPREKE